MQRFPVVWPWDQPGTIESWIVAQRQGLEVQEKQPLAVCLVQNKRLELLSPCTGLLSEFKKATSFSPKQELCQVIQCPHNTHFGGRHLVVPSDKTTGICTTCHLDVRHLATQKSDVIVSTSHVTVNKEVMLNFLW